MLLHTPGDSEVKVRSVPSRIGAVSTVAASCCKRRRCSLHRVRIANESRMRDDPAADMPGGAGRRNRSHCFLILEELKFIEENTIHHGGLGCRILCFLFVFLVFDRVFSLWK